jgi:thiamine biosynthesis lipoprotein
MPVKEHKSTHVAMATTFDIRIFHESKTYAKQVARVLFDEIDRLEKSLSRFVQSSDIAQINHLAAHEPVRVNIETIECLRLAEQMRQQTNGAFDITRAGKTIELCDQTFSVRLQDPDTNIDLGGIGKGFALDKTAELLDEWDIEAALLHGGGSSVLALGTPPGQEGWKLGVGTGSEEKNERRTILLRDNAISASGTQLKGQHIQDPRTGTPPLQAMRVWVKAPEAATTDALSTAFMILNPTEIEAYCATHQEVSALALFEENGEKTLRPFGNWN